MYYNGWVDRKGILTIKVKRNGKFIYIKNVWVKKDDTVIMEVKHKNSKTIKLKRTIKSMEVF
jgi:hypothetical protein